MQFLDGLLTVVCAEEYAYGWWCPRSELRAPGFTLSVIHQSSCSFFVFVSGPQTPVEGVLSTRSQFFEHSQWLTAHDPHWKKPQLCF